MIRNTRPSTAATSCLLLCLGSFRTLPSILPKSAAFALTPFVADQRSRCCSLTPSRSNEYQLRFDVMSSAPRTRRQRAAFTLSQAPNGIASLSSLSMAGTTSDVSTNYLTAQTNGRVTRRSLRLSLAAAASSSSPSPSPAHSDMLLDKDEISKPPPRKRKRSAEQTDPKQEAFEPSSVTTETARSRRSKVRGSAALPSQVQSVPSLQEPMVEPIEVQSPMENGGHHRQHRQHRHQQQGQPEEEKDNEEQRVAANNVDPEEVPSARVKKKSATTKAKTKAKTTKKRASSKKPRKIAGVPRKEPPGWEEVYSIVEELRSDRTAPVDTDGSEALPQKHEVTPQTYRFQVLIALMLSSQTKDAIVGEAMRKLQAHGLTVDNISQTPPEKLNELIRRVGFHNNKTKYIKKVVEILKDDYNGDIPPTVQGMMELPGVGPKMAYIVENVAWDRVTGIGVDTHMHRLFNVLGWVDSKTPEQTRLQLESWFPRERWGTVNLLWVGFGQEIQQFKPKLLRKALDSSKPADALKLLKKLGMDYKKEGAKADMTEDIEKVLGTSK